MSVTVMQLTGALEAALLEGHSRLGIPMGCSSALELAELPVPDDSRGPHNARLLRALGPLYLASELEAAQLLPTTEDLAGLWASGGLAVVSRATSDKLANFWRGRTERLTRAERQAIFARAFGGRGDEPVLAAGESRNDEFALRLLDLADAASASSERWGRTGPHEMVELELRARLLSENLVRHGNGFVLHAATEILANVQQAVELLKLMAQERVWGAHNLWGLIATYRTRARLSPVQYGAHIRRGQAGMGIISWLAELTSSPGGRVPLTVPHQVAAALARWVQASLVIEEGGVGAAA